MLPVADSSTSVPRRVSYARIAEKREIPNLIELQVRSFAWFVDKGLRELFDEISPIKDFTGKVMELQFLDYEFGDPKYSRARVPHPRPDLQPARSTCRSSSSSRRPARSSGSGSTWATTRG